MPKLTIERQRQIEQELHGVQQAMASPDAVTREPADIATKISVLARIVAELLAAFGHSDHAQAMDAEIRKPKP